MPIQYSYTDAAQRLIVDAFTIWQGGAVETAAHLAGLSAECVLKSIMIGLGIVTPAADGQVVHPHRIHIREDPPRTQLWSEFHAQLGGRAGSAFVAFVPPLIPHPFDGWRVGHRYAAARQISIGEAAGWMWAAIALRHVLDHAFTEGLTQ